MFAGVDRAAHQRHGQRHIVIVLALHAGDRGQHRNGGLAHRDHMRAAVQRVQHRDHVVDVVVEIEAALGDRHHAGIDPFGDVDVMVRQEGLDGAAQQRRVVTGHRGDDQHLGLRAFRCALQRALEMQQAAERPFPDAGDVHGNTLAADQGRRDTPIRLAVAARGALEQLERGRIGLAAGRMGEWVGGIFEKDAAGIRERARRRQCRVAHLVEPVHRRRQKRTAVAGQRRCPAEFTNRHVVWPRPDFLHCGRLSCFRHLVNPDGHGRVIRRRKSAPN